MRPPQYAGEIARLAVPSAVVDSASMRPPQYAGEIPAAAGAGGREGRRFNEAPAIRGGNPSSFEIRTSIRYPLQ